MDFLKNAAKIAEQVQGGKKPGEGSGGGYGDMVSGFMGGGGEHQAGLRRDEEADGYGGEDGGRHGSKPRPGRGEEDGYGGERPAENKMKPSAGELFGSAQVLYQAASGGKVDQGKLAGAASDLLEGLSMYGGNKSPYSAYAQQASSYLDSYGNKHEVSGARDSAKPPSGLGRPSEGNEDAYRSKPRPSKYESEESEYGDRPEKPHPSKYEDEEEDGGRRRPQRTQAEDEEYGGGYGRKPQRSQYDEEEPGRYGSRPQNDEQGSYGSGGHGRGSRTNDGEEESEKPKKSWYE